MEDNKVTEKKLILNANTNKKRNVIIVVGILITVVIIGVCILSLNSDVFNGILKNKKKNNETLKCELLYGDVNCDGKINQADADYLYKYIQEDSNYTLTEQGKKNADVYQDDKVNLKDYSVLTNYINKTEGYETLPYTPKQETKTIYGDVNCDGKINQADADYLYKYIQEDSNYTLTEQGKKNADVYQDDKVNLKDYSVLTNYINKTEGYETLPYTPKTNN